MKALQQAEHILEGEIRRHVDFLCLCDRTHVIRRVLYFQLSSTGLRRTMYRHGTIVAGLDSTLEFNICDNHFSPQ